MSYRHTTRLIGSNITSTIRLAQLSSHLNSKSSHSIRTMATSIPKTMKGVVIHKTGGVEVLEYKTDLPVPTPKEGEVLVKNEYIGVNYIDTYGIPSLYHSPSLESPSCSSHPNSLPQFSAVRQLTHTQLFPHRTLPLPAPPNPGSRSRRAHRPLLLAILQSQRPRCVLRDQRLRRIHLRPSLQNPPRARHY